MQQAEIAAACLLPVAAAAVPVPPGPYRAKDLVTLLPMLDELCVLGLTGAQLLEALENGVSQYPKLEGRFPCLAGITMTYDASKPGGARIDAASVKVKRRGGCPRPTIDPLPAHSQKACTRNPAILLRALLVNPPRSLEPLDLTQEYAVATKAYLALGKDGYDVFKSARLIADSVIIHFRTQSRRCVSAVATGLDAQTSDRWRASAGVLSSHPEPCPEPLHRSVRAQQALQDNQAAGDAGDPAPVS